MVSSESLTGQEVTVMCNHCLFTHVPTDKQQKTEDGTLRDRMNRPGDLALENMSEDNIFCVPPNGRSSNGLPSRTQLLYWVRGHIPITGKIWNRYVAFVSCRRRLLMSYKSSWTLGKWKWRILCYLKGEPVLFTRSGAFVDNFPYIHLPIKEQTLMGDDSTSEEH